MSNPFNPFQTHSLFRFPPGAQRKPGFIAWLFLLFWRWQQGSGTRSFAICCYSNSYKSLGSQPALFDGGWESSVLQVDDNQLNTNKAVPNLGTPISGRAGLLIPPEKRTPATAR